MGPTTRRVFLLQIAAVGPAMAATRPAQPGDPVHLDPKDAQAAALGYVVDATKADKKKYPKYAADQKCSTCQLYQGKAGEGAGACPIFAGKQVSASGWCSSWIKKA
jgi:hypothetical protein